ncbi:MAG: peptidylprolyl isomerase [Bacteroidales bacterium]|nr:peptidylprolyl isomerase [Bacteroidales bacterium]
MKKVLFFLLSLAFSITISAQDEQSTPKMVDEVIAVVGSKIILHSDIENQYIQYRMQGSIRGSAQETKCAILEGLLYSKLLINQAEVDSVVVGDKQVDTEVDRRVRYFIQQIGSKEKLEDYYKKPLFQIKEDLKEIIADQMRVEMVQNNITKTVTITPSEVRAFYKAQPSDSIPMINTEYVIGQIVKKPKVSLAQEIEVKEKLRALRRRVLDGESFNTMAILYSEDPGSAAKGGEVGLYGRGELYPEFEAVAFKLKEGEISDIVQSKAGFHIIQLIERRGEYVNTRHILITPKVSPDELAKSATMLDSIYNLIQDGSITYDDAVLKFSDDPGKNNGGLLINQATGTIRFSHDQLDPKALYVVDKLEAGKISKPIPYKSDEGQDAYRILYLKEKTKPHRANLREDYDKIQTWAQEHKKDKVIDTWVNERINNTYIRIQDEFKSCTFKLGWSK